MNEDLLTPLWGATEPPSLSLPRWSILVAQARVSRLLSRLAFHLADRGWLECVPDAPRAHLEGAMKLAERELQAVRWEIDRLRVALADLPGPVVLLKGAAYVAAGLPPARGRLFGDIDLLVPREQLARAEASLLAGGWVPQQLDPYDERYYRDWMHELPPFKHVWRHTWIDVHHTITPPTSRYAVDGRKLMTVAVPLPRMPGFATLAPHDLVLHCATHLLLDGELPHGLRDLLDLSDLLRHFGGLPGFWTGLTARARELGLDPLLGLALLQLQRLFGMPLRAEVIAGLRLQSRSAGGITTTLLSAALLPHHPSCSDARARAARQLLYLRAHALRMPLHQVLPHLGRKAWMRARSRWAGPVRRHDDDARPA